MIPPKLTRRAVHCSAFNLSPSMIHANITAKKGLVFIRTLARTNGIKRMPAMTNEKVAVLRIALIIRGNFRFLSTDSVCPLHLASNREPKIKKIPLDRRRSNRLIPREAIPYLERI